MSSPIMISLDMIAVHNPCKDGWKKILAARGGVSADRDALFPLTDALDSNGIDDTLWALRCIDGHDRLKRRFAAWCARQVMHLNDDPRVLAAIVAAEDFADGLIGDAARAAAYAASAAAYAASDAARAAAYAARAAASDAARAAAYAARAAASDAASAAARAAACDAARAAAYAASAAAYAARAAAYAARAAAYAASDAAYAASAAASDAAYAASAAAYAARAAQADKLREILTAGEWV